MVLHDEYHIRTGPAGIYDHGRLEELFINYGQFFSSAFGCERGQIKVVLLGAFCC